MNETRLLKMVFVLAIAIPASLGGAGCGGGDERAGGRFDVSGNVDRYAGPTPLTARFSAKSKHARGNVIYRWRFDDGTASRDQTLTHSFDRAGYYQVILDARDEAGNNDRETFLLGVWPQKQWTKSLKEPVTLPRVRAVQRVQQRRTDARHMEIRERLRRQAREQIEG